MIKSRFSYRREGCIEVFIVKQSVFFESNHVNLKSIAFKHFKDFHGHLLFSNMFKFVSTLVE